MITIPVLLVTVRVALDRAPGLAHRGDHAGRQSTRAWKRSRVLPRS